MHQLVIVHPLSECAIQATKIPELVFWFDYLHRMHPAAKATEHWMEYLFTNLKRTTKKSQTNQHICIFLAPIVIFCIEMIFHSHFHFHIKFGIWKFYSLNHPFIIINTLKRQKRLNFTTEKAKISLYQVTTNIYHNAVVFVCFCIMAVCLLHILVIERSYLWLFQIIYNFVAAALNCSIGKRFQIYETKIPVAVHNRPLKKKKREKKICFFLFLCKCKHPDI